jgi:hypothetical protein
MKISDFGYAAILSLLFLIVCAFTDMPEQERLAEEHRNWAIKQEKLEQAKLKAEYRRLAKQAEKMTMVGVEIK